MSFKVGDRVICSRYGRKEYSNMVGTVILITSNIIVSLDKSPFPDGSMLTWYFTPDEICKLTKLHKALN